jgi:hypothetical protein
MKPETNSSVTRVTRPGDHVVVVLEAALEPHHHLVVLEVLSMVVRVSTRSGLGDDGAIRGGDQWR